MVDQIENFKETKENLVLSNKYSEYSDSIYKDLNTRVIENKKMDLDSFFKQKQHYFIMTDGGKPIYSRYGDEVENCGILATFSAMMTKFTHYNNSLEGTKNEKLQ